MQNMCLCPQCKLEYSSENPPKKLINCSHNICFNCLQKQTILCSIDRVRIQRRKYTTQAFQTNQQILAFLDKKNTPKLQKQDKNEQNTPKLPLSSKSQNKSSRQKSLKQKTQISDFKQIEEKVIFQQSKQKSINKHKIGQSQITESNILKLSQSKQISPKKSQILKKKQSPNKQNQVKKHFHTPKDISPKRQGNSFEMCLLHSKKADLVCVQDKCLICVNCGLFGEHKQHTIIGYEQFLNKYSALTEQCFVNFEELQKVESNLNFEAIQIQINDMLSTKRKEQLNKIKDKSKMILNLIKLWQKQLITNLDNMIKFKKEKLLKQIDFEQLIMKKEEYLSNVLKMNEGLQDILNQQKIQKYIDFIDPKSKNSYILKQGQYLIMEIDNYTKMVQKKIQEQISQFTHEFEGIGNQMLKNIAVLKSKDISQIVKVKPLTPHKGTTVLIEKNKKTVQSPDRNLLIEPDSNSGSKQQNKLQVKDTKGSPIRPLENSKVIFDQSISPFNLKVNSILTESNSFNAHKRTQSFNNKSMQMNRPHKKHNYLDINGENTLQMSRAMNKSEAKSIKNETRCVTQRDILGQKCENRKKKKMDLPEKQSKMFEQLLKDKLQVFDIRANLGNSKILTISQQFPYSKKLKTVRLMQNKITDDIFPQLIHYCRDLHSLNLSYNLLTEKSLSWLEQQGFYLGDLPNIALSMNKIQLRNVKERLEQLKKKGINVTV